MPLLKLVKFDEPVSFGSHYRADVLASEMGNPSTGFPSVTHRATHEFETRETEQQQDHNTRYQFLIVIISKCTIPASINDFRPIAALGEQGVV